MSSERIPEVFRVAMLGQLTMGPPERPWHIGRLQREWLIVEKAGPAGRILQIIRCGPVVRRKQPLDQPAPEALWPGPSLLAIQVASGTMRFRFQSALPPGLRLDGPFHPATGIALLAIGPAGLGLTAKGQHLIPPERPEPQQERPSPCNKAELSTAWQLQASYRSWAGEV